MTKEEQDVFLNREYAEAIRYMDNANEVLGKAGVKEDGKYYIDVKYVRMACGTAYLGVLIALDAWLTVKDVELPAKNKHKTIGFYKGHLSNMDGKMSDYLETAYNQLHLEGYYRIDKNVKRVSAGFDAAYDIIEKIKPEHPVEVTESRAERRKRKWNLFLVSLSSIFY